VYNSRRERYIFSFVETSFLDDDDDHDDDDVVLSLGSQIKRAKTLRPQLLPARRAFLLRLDGVFDAGVAKDVATVGRHQMPVVALDLRLIVEADRTRNAGGRGGGGG